MTPADDYERRKLEISWEEWAHHTAMEQEEHEAREARAREDVEAYLDEHYAFAVGCDRELLTEAGLRGHGRLDTDIPTELAAEWRETSRVRRDERHKRRGISAGRLGSFRLLALVGVRRNSRGGCRRPGVRRVRRVGVRARGPDDSGDPEPPGVAPGDVLNDSPIGERARVAA